jgi:hypothetical protein
MACGLAHPTLVRTSACDRFLAGAEVEHLRGPRNPARCRRKLLLTGFLEAVLDEEVQVITLVEDLAAQMRIQLSQPPNFAVLLGHELLAHRGDLDEQILVGKVEIRSKELAGCAFVIPFDGELLRLVLPRDIVEIEESRELALALVSEIDLVGR